VKKIVKIVLGIFVVLLFVGIIGSSGDNTTNQAQTKTPSSNSEAASAPASAPTTYKIGDRVVVGERAYTVTNVKTASYVGDEYYKVKADGIFVIVSMTIENIGKESGTMSTNDAKIIDSQGRTYESDNEAWSSLNDNLFLKQIQPGLPAKGETIFDVPKGITCNLEVSEGGWGTDTKLIALGNT